ncbi:hypothetical protein BGW41_005898 [Actinomortierella wolfii]|nr:hypothetical protein BGW41_005898 [Actinomortierella wolfii]
MDEQLALSTSLAPSNHSSPLRTNSHAGSDHLPFNSQELLDQENRPTTPPPSGRSFDSNDLFSPSGHVDEDRIENDDEETNLSLSQQAIGSPNLRVKSDQGSLGVFGISNSPSGETLRRLTLSPHKSSSSKAKKKGDIHTLVPGTPVKVGSTAHRPEDGSLGPDEKPLERPASSFMDKLLLTTVNDKEVEEKVVMMVDDKPHQMFDLHESSSDSEVRRRAPQPKARPLKPRRKKEPVLPPQRDLSMTSPLGSLSISPSLHPQDVGSQKDKAMVLSDDDMLTLDTFKKDDKSWLKESDSSSSDLDDPFSDPFLSGTELSDSITTKDKSPPQPPSPTPTQRNKKQEPPIPDPDLMLTDEELPPPPHELRSRSGRVLRSTAVAVEITAASKTRFKPTKKKALFSLDLLLKEKERREAGGFNMSRHIEEAMSGQVLEEYDTEEEEEILFGTDKIIPKDILSEEQKEVLTEVLAEEETQLVEDAFDFFTQWPRRRSIPRLDVELGESVSAFSPHSAYTVRVVQSLRMPGMYKAFLLSPFMHMLIRSKWEIPRAVYSWLVDVMALETDFSVVNAISALLQHAARRIPGTTVIRPEDIVRVCQYYGAKDEVLATRWRIAPITAENKPQRILGARSSPFPKDNLQRVILLVQESALAGPQEYTCEDIRMMVNILLRIVTDPIVGDIKSSVMTAIGTLLDAIPESARGEQRTLLVQETIHTFGESLPFMLLILGYWPATNAWTMLTRRSIAVVYLGLTAIPEGSDKPMLQDITNFVQSSPVFTRNHQTDYRKMTQTVKMLGYCLDDDALIASYNYQGLKELILILRQMHGKIVDIRAAFLDRTHAKDALQRLFTRLFYAGVHRSGPAQSTLNFDSRPLGSADSTQNTEQGVQPNTPMDTSSLSAMDILSPAEAAILNQGALALSDPKEEEANGKVTAESTAATAALGPLMQPEGQALATSASVGTPPSEACNSSPSDSEEYLTPEPMPGSPI